MRPNSILIYLYGGLPLEAATTEALRVGAGFLVQFAGRTSNVCDGNHAIFGADEILAMDRS
jgi:hypothetical protein